MKPTAANIKQKYGSERRFDMLEIKVDPPCKNTPHTS